MSWELIESRKPISVQADVVISTKVSGKHKIPTVVISLRTPPAWLNRLATVDVAVGRDDHAGQLRITSGGAYSLRKFNKGQTRAVTVSAWRDCTLRDLKQAPCVFKDDGTAMIVHLPGGSAPTPAHAPAPAPKASNGSAATKPPAAAAEPRGKPGVAQPPIAKPWRQIQDDALKEGVELASRNDLPAYNKKRISKGLAPYAIA